jgi:proteasome lid subunit RPN8/RPN11
MTDARSLPDDSIDVRLLSRQDLPQETFPGGRNEGFRVFFSPEVHAAIWKHAAEDTSVEICGVLVGSWHRDLAGPFIKIIESIRGEGAETRFAEVTFTHQTWAKINSEMDTRFSKLSIVGWYHTHPDFGIFLSDRDRFIQEHFFCGPGQVAHVIDPIRKIEGVFVWREAKPVLTPHFWVGDRVVVGTSGAADGDLGSSTESRSLMRTQAIGRSASGAPGQGQRPGSSSPIRARIPPSARLILYGGVFMLGYLIAKFFSAWEQQRFVESVLASNGFVAILRLGLSDELDRLNADLAALARPLEAVQSGEKKENSSLADVRAQLAGAARRVSMIKAQYGNTPAEDELLRQLLRDKLTGMAQTRSQPASAGPVTKPGREPDSISVSPGDGKTRENPNKSSPTQP